MPEWGIPDNFYRGCRRRASPASEEEECYMSTYLGNMTDQFMAYAPQLGVALLILVVGWLLAAIIAAITRGVIKRTSMISWLSAWFPGGPGAKGSSIDRKAGKFVFYLLLIVVFVAFIQALGLTFADRPLNEMLTQMLGYAPRIIGVLILLFIAWIIAGALKLLVTRTVSASKLEERLGEAKEPGAGVLARSLGQIVYWLVFILFLPAFLGALALDGLLEPVKGMTQQFLAYLPNIFAALVIAILGWFASRIVQRLVSNLLAAVGVDKLSEKAGLNQTLGERKLSHAFGLVVQVLVLIPVFIAVLNALALDSLTQPTSHMLDMIISALPGILGASLVLLLSYLVGRVVGGVVASLLASVGFNSLLVKLGIAKEEPAEGKRTLSNIAGNIVVLIIMFFAATEAAQLMGFSALAGMVTEMTRFAGNLILGLVILAVGLWIANLTSDTIKGTAGQHADAFALAAKIAIMVLVIAMALREMGVANEIVTLAFGLVGSAVAVASAIAFGIGGREIAKRKLDEWLK